MTALATASLAVVAWIIARIAFASGSRGKSGLTATAAPPTHRFSSV
jgi:ABC-type cobalamin transport system permease subunit